MGVDDFGLGYTGTLTASSPAHTGHAVGDAERSPRKGVAEEIRSATTYVDVAGLEVQ